jgi:hypothetical protein
LKRRDGRRLVETCRAAMVIELLTKEVNHQPQGAKRAEDAIGSNAVN